MKKYLSLLIVVLMLVSLLGGCVKQGTEKPKNDVSAETSAEKPPEASAKEATDAPVELELMWLNQSPEVTRWAELIVDEFEAENPGVTIKMNVVNQEEYFTKLQTLVAAGQCPDVFWEWNAEIGSMIDANKLVDLADYINMETYLPTYRMASLVEYYRPVWEGHVWGIPLSFSNYMYVYNPSLYKAAGVEPSTDYHTWMDAAKAIKDSTGAYFIGLPTTSGDYQFNGYFFQIMLTNYGGCFTDGNGGAAIDTELNRELMQVVADLFHNGYIAPDAGWTDYNAMFAQGKVACTTDGSYTYGTYTGYNPDFNLDMYDVIPVGGDNYKAVGCGMNFLSIGNSCKKPEVAAKLVEKITETKWSYLNDYVNLGYLKEMEEQIDNEDTEAIQAKLFELAPFVKSFVGAGDYLKPVQQADVTAGEYTELQAIVGLYMEEIFYNNMPVADALSAAQVEAETLLGG